MERHVSQAITRGDVGPGDRLPTERELAVRFGVRRGTVRTALARLEREGFISRHVGRGTFVSMRRQHAGIDDAHFWRGVSPTEVMDARLLVEPELTRMFVSNASEEDIDRVRTCIIRGEAATSFDEFERWDEALHEAIVDGTKNRLLQRFYENVKAVRREADWGAMKRRAFSVDMRRAIEHQHREIFGALADRDAEKARGLLLGHLQFIRKSLITM